MIVKESRRIDSKGRITIPKPVLKLADLEEAEVLFDITRSGNLVLRKANKDKKEMPSSLE